MNRELYPPDWAKISERIRFTRAGGRCECTGECGIVHFGAGGRCPARHLDRHFFDPYTSVHVFFSPENDERLIAAQSWLMSTETEIKTIYLTTAHLWQGECAACHERGEKCAIDSHLLAMCCACHLAYDLPHHILARQKTLAEYFDRQRGLFDFLREEK